MNFRVGYRVRLPSGRIVTLLSRWRDMWTARYSNGETINLNTYEMRRTCKIVPPLKAD